MVGWVWGVGGSGMRNVGHAWVLKSEDKVDGNIWGVEGTVVEKGGLEIVNDLLWVLIEEAY